MAIDLVIANGHADRIKGLRRPMRPRRPIGPSRRSLIYRKPNRKAKGESQCECNYWPPSGRRSAGLIERIDEQFSASTEQRGITQKAESGGQQGWLIQFQ